MLGKVRIETSVSLIGKTNVVTGISVLTVTGKLDKEKNKCIRQKTGA